jgi:transposase
MDESDLSGASRAALLALIGELRAGLAERDALIAELQKRIGALEERLGARGGPGMPGHKPPPTKPKPPPKARKKRAHGFGRPRMSPTTTVAHAVDACPDCGTHLVGGWVQRTRQVLELPIQPVEVIEHQYLARECPLCGKRHVPRVALDGLVLGRRHRLGLRLVSRIVTLREAGRLPFATIQWYLATVHGLHLSVGELVGVVQSVAKRASPAVEQIRAAIQDSAVVHADETGWREKGVNGYVWTFSTPTARYFTRGKRSKEVVDTALGPAFAGVLVSDFYAAYHHYPGVHQRCWAHLLRDIHELKDVYPTDAGLADWAAVVLALYREGADFVGPDEAARLAKQRELEERLSAACRPFAADPLAVQRKLCRRIARHLKELFVFVGDPRVPATNNAAERSLRPLVTSRKISGGTQSETGTTSKTTLASLFGTWRAQGRNPLDECLHLLQSPHQ